jgi:hypothetical protein
MYSVISYQLSVIKILGMVQIIAYIFKGGRLVRSTDVVYSSFER